MFNEGCEGLKNFGIIISFIFFILFGIMVGSHLNANIRVQDETFNPSPNRENEAQEVVQLKKTNLEMKQRINELALEVATFEKEWATENIILKKLRSDVNHYKMLAGHSSAVGPGAVITLEGMMGENIADIVETKRYLLNLVNELRFFDAEVISINDQRLTGRSEIVFAGNHINVNGHSIAPPYQLKVIGNTRALQRYIQHGTFIFDMMNADGIRTTILFQDDITIPAIQREKPIEFLRGIDEVI